MIKSRGLLDRSLNRRKALKIIAAASALPLVASAPLNQQARAETFTWQGRALGVEAEMQFVHSDAKFVKKIIESCVSEIDRLEEIFSLYRPSSEINRLNRKGHLKFASPELRTVLAEAQRFSILSDGAFDVTVQPLWKERNSSLKNVNYKNLHLSGLGVEFTQENMAITLNGIAQGYITDRVTQLLKRHGFNHVLLQLGEMHVEAPTDQPWRIALNNKSGKKIALSSGAIATSSAAPFKSKNLNHLLDPRTGNTPNHFASVSVIAPTAMTADAFSTALYIAGPAQAEKIVNNSTIKLAVLEPHNGDTRVLRGKLV